jgi:hypothetical protein
MKFLSRLAEKPLVNYESTKAMDSKAVPGVRFAIQRMSFGRRMALCQQIREIAPKLEFLEAGSEFAEKVEANLLGQEIENLYLRWGLAGVEGLSVDGGAAAVELLIARGPETLAKEIVAAIQAECRLTEEERKD